MTKRRLLAQLQQPKTILVLLFLFAFGLRVMYLNDGMFHNDTVGMAKIIETAHREGFLHLFSDKLYSLRSGIMIINFFLFTIHTALTGYPHADLVMNWSSALFGALAVVFLYLFTDKLIRKRFVAVSASLLFAVSPVFLSISTYGKEHAMHVAFLLASFYFVLLGHEHKRLWPYIVSGICFGYAAICRESTVFFGLFFLLLYFQPRIADKKMCIPQERFAWKRLLACFGPLALIVGIHLYFFLFDRILWVVFHEAEDTSAGRFGWFLAKIFGFALHRLVMSLTFVLIPFVIAGAVWLWKNKQRFVLAFLFLWCLLFYYYANNTIFAPRWLSEVLPAFYILGSIGLYWLYQKQKAAAVVVLIYIIVSLFFAIHPVIAFRHEFSAPKEFALFFDTHSEGNAIVFTNVDWCTFVDYYTDKSCRGLYYTINNLNEILEEIDAGKSVYVDFIDRTYQTSDRAKNFWTAVDEQFKTDVQGTITLEGYHKKSDWQSFFNSSIVHVEKFPGVTYNPFSFDTATNETAS